MNMFRDAIPKYYCRVEDNQNQLEEIANDFVDKLFRYLKLEG